MRWYRRFDWFGVPILLAIVALAAAYFWATVAYPESLTDSRIVTKIIAASRNEYYATGHPCACPYDHARNGSLCGGRSAYSRPGGAEPKCYPKDVSAGEIADYRRSHL